MGKTQINSYLRVLRIINIFTSSMVVVLSCLSLVFVVISAISSLKFFLIFSPVWMIAFGLAMLAAEFNVKFVLKRLPFLKTLLGRALFNIYLSSIIFYYFDSSDQPALAWVGAISLFVSGIVYLCFYFGCGKKLEDQKQRKRSKQDPEVEPDTNQTPGRQPLM